jgi:CheY-like chemotaxis protein
VIDPNVDDRAIFALQLGGIGVTPDSVSSLAEAEQQLEAGLSTGRLYSLIFVHHDCPDADPLQAARAVRAACRAGTPVVMLLTRLGASPPQAALEAAGAAGIIHTPVRPSQLASLVAAAWEKQHRQPDAMPILPEPIEDDQRFPRWRVTPRVLVAEDNVINQQVAQHLLQLLGCRVDVVANGLEALDALANVPYDLVFMDCQMPECDGYEAARRLRRTASPRARVPVIAMTANVMPGDRQRCLDAGMDDYVAKPVHAEEIDAMLRGWLAQYLATDEDATPTLLTGPTPVLPMPAVPAFVTAEPSDAPAIDAKIVSSLKAMQARGTRQTLIADLLTVFASQAQEIGDVLLAALGASDLGHLREAAHKFKGACGSIGAAQLAARSKDVELAAREGRRDDAAVACNELLRLVPGAVGALEAAYRDAIT